MSGAQQERSPPPRRDAVFDARKAGATPDASEFSYVVLEGPLGASEGERRRGTRQRMRLRSGKLLGRDGQFICECLIHNRSASGGRLRLGGMTELPAAFYFYDDQSSQLYDATVIWRKEREVGARIGACAPSSAHRAIAEQMRQKFYALKR